MSNGGHLWIWKWAFEVHKRKDFLTKRAIAFSWKTLTDVQNICLHDDLFLLQLAFTVDAHVQVFFSHFLSDLHNSQGFFYCFGSHIKGFGFPEIINGIYTCITLRGKNNIFFSVQVDSVKLMWPMHRNCHISDTPVTLIMEVVCFSKTSGTIYQITRHHIISVTSISDWCKDNMKRQMMRRRE
jgi:hypothetical protein